MSDRPEYWLFSKESGKIIQDGGLFNRRSLFAACPHAISKAVILKRTVQVVGTVGDVRRVVAEFHGAQMSRLVK